MITTKFFCSGNDYTLIVDISKEATTTAWLNERGCEFSVFASKALGCNYCFSSIPKEVVEAISKKYPR